MQNLFRAGFPVRIASGSKHEGFHLIKPSLHFCKHNIMTPLKKDSYGRTVTTGLENAISGSQIASSGHKNMRTSPIFAETILERSLSAGTETST